MKKQNPFDIHTAAYEEWFQQNSIQYQSELLALQQAVPKNKKGVEIGVGTGIFAQPLGVSHGIDPSAPMLEIARTRDIEVTQALAEELPFEDSTFDYTLFITSICFIDNPKAALQEAHRVTKEGGTIIVAIIDGASDLGKALHKRKDKSKFYAPAYFFSADDIVQLLQAQGYTVTESWQTLIENNPTKPEQPIKGTGQGGFVVIKGEKQ